tara:strand:+ start:185 stop:1042 length:858 start_codon:yes stop_codon:yes gene_type:complete
MKIKHNKLRNTGLLFEFLLRQITTDTLSNNKESVALKIVKKFINEKTELGKEFSLYSIILNKKFKTDKKAEFFLNEVVKERQSLNKTQLRREKYNLIKEIKKQHNLQKLFSTKVKPYKVYASIYKIFEHYSDLSAEEKTITFFNLIEHVTTQKKKTEMLELVNPELVKDKDLRIITYRILLENFNKKYKHLNAKQRNLLRAYINNVSNENSLKEHINEEIPSLKKSLKKHSKIVSEKVVKIKLNEAINSINKFCGIDSKAKNIKDSVIIHLLHYYELEKELKSRA